MSASKSRRTVKPQTPMQRVANPVWLRAQLGELIADCAENITADLDQVCRERDDVRRARLHERIESHRHWQLTFERILRGETLSEAIAKIVDAWRTPP